jgi:hypothetical protein
MEPARQQGQPHHGKQHAHKNFNQTGHPRQTLNLNGVGSKFEPDN